MVRPSVVISEDLRAFGTLLNGTFMDYLSMVYEVFSSLEPFSTHLATIKLDIRVQRQVVFETSGSLEISWTTWA